MVPILLLHGALGSTAQFDALERLKPEGQVVFALNFPGHGGSSNDSNFSMQLFSDSVIKFMDENNLNQVEIFGYSMGGYVALWLARKYPLRVLRVSSYGTKLAWTPEVATGMHRMFDPEKIEAKAPLLAQLLAQTHGAEHWKTLCQSTKHFLDDLGNGLGLPPGAYEAIKAPVRIGWGDLDQVVTENESLEAASSIPSGQFVRIPGGKHLIEQVDAQQLAAFVFS